MLKPKDRKSLAFQEGERARRDGLKLEETAVKNLRVGSRQYADYMAGYDPSQSAQCLRQA